MSTLDDKLQNILESYYGNVEMNIQKIKQAFADAGYRHNFAAKLFDTEVEKYVEQMGFMSGQEWYNRFDKELQPDDDWIVRNYSRDDIMAAAMKAAGII